MTVRTNWFKGKSRSIGQIYSERWKKSITEQNLEEFAGTITADEAFIPVENYFKSDYSFYEGNRNILTDTKRINSRTKSIILSIAGRKRNIVAVAENGDRFRLTPH